MKSLYDWLFHYNHHVGLWAAFRREDKEFYFNSMAPKPSNNGKIYYNTKFETLVDLIESLNGRNRTNKK